ncbi:transporter substrate-binding domain-containing protein [Trinickia mobilis]|uniref:transporter substrate-binding domain-containing protein n=1 Tax=Trinickia mobilis TaxID=2816356 RepID=UPI001A8DAE15|nr:transporter substrate-binding domain-containing protein [Trinickia mobilis]
MAASLRRTFIKTTLVIAAIAGFAPQLALAEGGTLADIKARGMLTVGTEAAYEPYEFVEDSKVVGYGHDILEYMVRKLGVRLNQLNLPFQGLLPGLLTHKFDLVATSVGITEERAKRFAFTRPIGVVHSLIVVSSSNQSIAKPEDIAGKIVGTQMGSSAQPMVNDYEQVLKAKKGKGYANVKLLQSYPDVETALENGTLDVGVVPSNVLAVAMRKQPGKFKVIGEIGQPKLLAWVVNPNDKEILTFVNSTLDEMRANGKLAELQKKWFGEAMDLPASGYLPQGAL